MEMFIDGAWHASDAPRMPVTNPRDGSQVDTVPDGAAGDSEVAVASALGWGDRMGSPW